MRQIQESHPNVGFRCALGHLRSKGLKAKKVRLRLTLKNLKNSQPIKMDVISRQARRNRKTNSIWHLDHAQKLVQNKFVISGAADGHSHRMI